MGCPRRTAPRAARRRMVARCAGAALRGAGGSDCKQNRETERRAAAERAGDGQIAAHQLGQHLDDGEPKPGSAIAPRDVGIGLRERTKQPLDLGGLKPDAAVGDGETSLISALRAARAALHLEPHRARSVNFTALSMRFSSAARSRTGSPISVSGKSSRDRRLGLQAFGLRAGGKRFREHVGDATGLKHLPLQGERARAGFGGVDDQRGERSKMLGADFDARWPSAARARRDWNSPAIRRAPGCRSARCGYRARKQRKTAPSAACAETAARAFACRRRGRFAAWLF